MLEAFVIFAAGIWAGGINVIVGSGTVVTFPTLLLFGYPPLMANISNNIGMVAGGVSGVYGYRRELLPNRPLLGRLAPASVLGALAGALLLLTLPAESFKAIVPSLIGIGLVMVVVGPSRNAGPPDAIWSWVATVTARALCRVYFSALASSYSVCTGVTSALRKAFF